jgi:hypothetical protein
MELLEKAPQSLTMVFSFLYEISNGQVNDAPVATSADH